MSKTRQAFLDHVDKFIEATGVLEGTIGLMATGRRDLISRVRAGENVELASLEKCEELIAAHRDRSNAFKFPSRSE